MPSLFFKPIQLNLQLANLLIQPIFLSLIIRFTLLLATAESFTGSIEQLLFPIIDLAGMNLKFRCQLTDGIVALMAATATLTLNSLVNDLHFIITPHYVVVSILTYCLKSGVHYMCRLALSLRSPTEVAPIVGLRASAQPTGIFRFHNSRPDPVLILKLLAGSLFLEPLHEPLHEPKLYFRLARYANTTCLIIKSLNCP